MKLTEMEEEQGRLNMEERQRKTDEAYNRCTPDVHDEWYKSIQEDIRIVDRDLEIAEILLKNGVSRLDVLRCTCLPADWVYRSEQNIKKQNQVKRKKDYATVGEYVLETLKSIRAIVAVYDGMSTEDFQNILKTVDREYEKREPKKKNYYTIEEYITETLIDVRKELKIYMLLKEEFNKLLSANVQQ